MILLVDNYDSFSYNLFQYIGEFDRNIKVIRNDELTVEEIEKLNPNKIIISPGPGKPKDAGLCEKIIEHFASKIPILGICLGHQAIAETFGGEIVYAPQIMHGKTSTIKINKNSAIFNELPNEIKVARYHSLVAKKETFPSCLEILAETKDGIIMALKHKEYNVFGLQFHPESILTENGKKIIQNFLKV